MSDDQTFKREVSVRMAEEGDGRTLVARLVPYGEIANVSDGGAPYQERFARGAFKAQMRAAHRVKVFLNYRHGQALQDQIGHATQLDDGEDGLHGHLRVLEHPDGDKALELVRAGVLDKLSIEFASLKHRVVDGVTERLSARLIGVALVPEGAYSSAEVIAVREEAEPVHEALAALEPELAERLARFVTVPTDLLAARSFTEQPWDDSASRWPSLAAYARSCAIDDNEPGQPKTRALCHLPFVEPTGEVNINAVRDALAAIDAARTAPASKSAASRRLARLLAEYEETVRTT